MTAVGFLYRYGYFSQSLSMDGQQIANYEPQSFDRLPIDQVMGEDGLPMVLEVPYPGRIVYAHVWRVNVGRMKLYLMDTGFRHEFGIRPPDNAQALWRGLGKTVSSRSIFSA